jgi:hypothetical protein
MKKLTILITLVLIAGCSRDIPNPASYPSLPTAPLTPSSLTIAVGDRTLTLGWRMADTANIANYMVYRADSLSGQFRFIDSTLVLSFADSNLQNGHQYYYQIASVDTAHFEGNRSERISGTPNLYGVIINNGNLTTTSRIVNLTMVAPSTTTLMRISNAVDFAGSSWESFASTRQWLLTTEPGLKSVYAMYRDSNSNTTSSASIANITYQIEPYQYSILANSGAISTHSRNVTLTIGAPDGTSFMKIATDEAFTNAHWENFASSKNWLITPQSGHNGDTIIFYAQFQDQNHDSVSVQAQDSILLAFADPVQLFPVYQAVNQYQTITVRWSRSLSSDFASYRLFRSRGTSAVDTLTTNIADIGTTAYTDSTHLLSLPDTTPVSMYYMVRFYSTFDDSTDSDTIRVILRNQPPSTISCFVSSVSYTIDSAGIANLTATVGWSRSEIPDFSNYVLYESTSPNNTNARPMAYVYERATLSQQINKSNVDTTAVYHYWLKVFDLGGQSSAYSQPDSIYRR